MRSVTHSNGGVGTTTWGRTSKAASAGAAQVSTAAKMAANLRNMRTRRNLVGETQNPILGVKSMVAPAANKKRTALGDIGNAAPTRAVDAAKKEVLKPVMGQMQTTKTRRQVTEAVKVPSPEPMEVQPEADKGEPMEVEDLAQKAVIMQEALFTDIDAEDEGNPQLLAEYVNDIYGYMRELEVKQGVQQGYLERAKSSITPKMRTVLVDWIVEVAQQFSLLQETLFMAVAIFDRYMCVGAATVTKKSLQLVGVTALFLASKYEEIYAPAIDDFVYITDKAYSADQIRHMEMEILRGLNFDLGRPLPLHFLRRGSKAGFVDGQVHALAKYVMELGQLEYKLVSVRPSLLAAAALAFALRVLDPAHTSLRELWTPTLAHYTRYEVDEIAQVVQTIGEIVQTIYNDVSSSKKMKAIPKKYNSKKNMHIASISSLSKPIVAKIAAGEL